MKAKQYTLTLTEEEAEAVGFDNLDTRTETKSLHYYYPSDGRKKRLRRRPWIVTVGRKEIARFGDRMEAYAFLKTLPGPYDKGLLDTLAGLGSDGWAMLAFLGVRKNF